MQGMQAEAIAKMIEAVDPRYRDTVAQLIPLYADVIEKMDQAEDLVQAEEDVIDKIECGIIVKEAEYSRAKEALHEPRLRRLEASMRAQELRRPVKEAEAEKLRLLTALTDQRDELESNAGVDQVVEYDREKALRVIQWAQEILSKA